MGSICSTRLDRRFGKVYEVERKAHQQIDRSLLSEDHQCCMRMRRLGVRYVVKNAKLRMPNITSFPLRSVGSEVTIGVLGIMYVLCAVENCLFRYYDMVYI